MFSAFLPKGAPFFELLLHQNTILCKIALVLADILETDSTIEQPHREIALLETEADTIHATITRHLSQTFITPIDREDILRINKTQEDAIDLFHHLANRLYIFEFARIRFPMLQLARTMKDMTLLTHCMLEGLSRKCDTHNTKSFRSLRGDCEMLLGVGLAELYDLDNPTPEDLLDVFKWTQAYERIELAFNQVSQLAETIEEAVLKNV